MSKVIDLKDKRFGKLVVVERKENSRSGKAMWLCQCDCGNLKTIVGSDLTKGSTQSCGCIRIEKMKERKKEYNHRERLYVLWMGIRQRCANPNNISYKWYGEKGISICKEWEEDYLSFKKWMLDNGYDESLPRGVQTIDRIDSDGDYAPSNCRLITIAEQQRNKKCLKKYFYNGERHLLCEWSEILGIDYGLLHSRVIGYGWSLKEAIERPFGKTRGKDYIYVEIDGETKSLFQISKESSISHNALVERYKRGMDIKEVIEEFKRNGNSFIKKYECHGKKLTIPEWSREIGVPEGTLRSRIYAGKPYEEVFVKK